MKHTFASLLIILLPLFVAAQGNQATRSRPLVLNHVTVIDMTGRPARPDMAVVIQADRIIRIGRSSKIRIAGGAQLIDATGKYLIPGLWDMHAHLGSEEFDSNAYLRLFIANGVTGIRIMDGAPEHHLWRREIKRGTLLGPRMLIASPIIGFADSSNLSATQVRQEVRKAKQEGADFIKVHDNVLRESYFALIDEAKRVGLTVAGHVPNSIAAEAASDAGQKSIEHFGGLDKAKSDNSNAEALSAVFRKNGTRLCPTIIMRSNYASLDNASLANDPRLQYVKPGWRKRWLRMTKEAVNIPAAEWSRRKELVRKEKALVGEMQRAGVQILAGTDDGNPYSIPGFSLHDELAMVVEAGLTPMQALQAATFNTAEFLNKLKTFGTVEKGKLADLVLLDANPLEDIKNTRRINAVVVNGKYFSKEALQQILAEVASVAKEK